jgi:hypothetical protein
MESFLATTEDDPSFNLETEKVNMEKALKKTGGNVVKRERVSSMDGKILHLVGKYKTWNRWVYIRHILGHEFVRARHSS